MGVTNRLLFDPSNTGASSSIGAYVLAGTDGDQIGSETLNSLEWLRVTGPIIDSSGNEVGVTSNALDVNVASGSISADMDGVYNGATNTDPDNIGLIVHDRAASPADSDQSFRTTGGAASADNVTAANVHGLDVNSFLMGYDGTTWDRLTASNTAGALDVHLAGGTLTTSDAALADTAIENTATAVSTSAVNVVSSALANRKYLFLANEGNKSLYFGKSGVTTANGWPLHKGMALEARIGPSVTAQIIGDTGASSEDLRVMELS